MSVIVDFRCFPVARCALFQSNCLNNILIYDLFVLSCSLEMRTTHLTFRLATALFFQIMQEVFRHTTFILREKKNFVPSYWISSRFMGKWSSSKYARTHTYGSWNFDWIIRCCISFCPFFFASNVQTLALHVYHYFEVCHLLDLGMAIPRAYAQCTYGVPWKS